MKAKTRRSLFLISAVFCALAGVSVVCLGVLWQVGEKHAGPTLQTTAVVSDKEIETHKERRGRGPTATTRTVKDFWVYLDFSDSRMDKELIELLTQRQQGIELRHKEDYNSFYVGQYVTVVYHSVESIEGKVCIESVDGCELWNASGDLTTPHTEQSLSILFWVLGGLMLAMAALLSVGYYTKRKGTKRYGGFISG